MATLTVQRGGKTVVLPLKLAAAPETPPRDAIRIKSRSPFQGALVMNVSPAVAEELSLDNVGEGVVVADVAEGSLAANFGVQKGDVVLEVNGAKIATTRDLEAASGQRRALLGSDDRARRPSDPHAHRRLTPARRGRLEPSCAVWPRGGWLALLPRARRRLIDAHSVAHFLRGRAVRVDLGDAQAVARGFLIVDARQHQRRNEAAHFLERGDRVVDARGLLGRRALVEHEDEIARSSPSRRRASGRWPTGRRCSGARE